jgi:hypothetical protein
MLGTSASMTMVEGRRPSMREVTASAARDVAKLLKSQFFAGWRDSGGLTLPRSTGLLEIGIVGGWRFR